MEHGPGLAHTTGTDAGLSEHSLEDKNCGNKLVSFVREDERQEKSQVTVSQTHDLVLRKYLHAEEESEDRGIRS
jgi:hypothetical protein